MCLHVLVKVLLHVEVLAAPLAHELLVPNVDAHVRAELVLVLEPLVAVLHWTQGMVLDAKHRGITAAYPHRLTGLFSYSKHKLLMAAVWICHVPVAEL